MAVVKADAYGHGAVHAARAAVDGGPRGSGSPRWGRRWHCGPAPTSCSPGCSARRCPRGDRGRHRPRAERAMGGPADAAAARHHRPGAPEGGHRDGPWQGTAGGVGLLRPRGTRPAGAGGGRDLVPPRAPTSGRTHHRPPGRGLRRRREGRSTSRSRRSPPPGGIRGRPLASGNALRPRPSRDQPLRHGAGRFGFALGLVPAMTLEAELTTVKRVPAGTPVSYGHTATVGATTLGVVPLGYADGIPGGRRTGASVTVGGRPARGRAHLHGPVRGRPGSDATERASPVTSSASGVRAVHPSRTPGAGSGHHQLHDHHPGGPPRPASTWRSHGPIPTPRPPTGSASGSPRLRAEDLDPPGGPRRGQDHPRAGHRRRATGPRPRRVPDLHHRPYPPSPRRRPVAGARGRLPAPSTNSGRWTWTPRSVRHRGRVGERAWPGPQRRPPGVALDRPHGPDRGRLGQELVDAGPVTARGDRWTGVDLGCWEGP